MLSKLLDYFPPNSYPVYLVSDPDALLADEEVLSALFKRGFQIVQESDPILFRHRIEQTKPFNSSEPVLVITEGALEDLPYDVWNQGKHIQLALHEFFPTLAYPIIRSLTSLQRLSLELVKGPEKRLGEQKTIQFLLEHVFQFTNHLVDHPAHFVLWLDEFHNSLAPFPPGILDYVLELFRNSTNFQGWNIKGLLQDRETFNKFVQGQWRGFLSMQTSKSIGEKEGEYLLHFETDQKLQDALPRLLRNGSLAPVQMETEISLPDWVLPGILIMDEDPRPLRANELLAQLRETLTTLTGESRWDEWKAFAYQWAELTKLRNELGWSKTEEENDKYKETQARLDEIFHIWLSEKYSTLATQKLPTPHHVHHVPHYMNYLKSQESVQKVALLVMDGMSLSDWLLLKQVWQLRQPGWKLKENLLLAQIPTITAISRHSLISGLRPADFYIPHAIKLTEPKAWSAFWMQEGLPENAMDLIPLKLDKIDVAPEITNPRLQALCLIERQLDEIMHGSMLGEVDHQATVNLWLTQGASGLNSSKLEKVINLLLGQHFTVFLTSDHGHCESYGMGRPTSEGLTVQSRGRRARMYSDRRSAEQVQITFNQTILWEDDGLLPKDLFALLPMGRQAFTEHGEVVITHGGITIDEVIVPLIEISKYGN